jgi:hypothetical protein
VKPARAAADDISSQSISPGWSWKLQCFPSSNRSCPGPETAFGEIQSVFDAAAPSYCPNAGLKCEDQRHLQHQILNQPPDRVIRQRGDDP